MSRDPHFWSYLLLAVVAGGLGGIHVPINGALGARIESSLVATLAFYGVAFLVVSAVCALAWDPAPVKALTEVPRWYFLAGVISVIVVGSSTFLIPRIGAVNLFVVFVAAQLLVRMVVSHFGWLESPVSPMSWWKLLGGVLLVVGAVMVVRE